MGRFANAENLLSQSGRFFLEPGDARSLIARMEAQVRNEWYRIARSAGVSERDCEKIAPAFAYPGFGHQHEGGASAMPNRRSV
jgi:serine/threonine-protein kinase HipA